MCGFIVIKSNKITNKIRKSFKKSLFHLEHRGPDETRFIEKKNYLIGFTRLSINDINTASQPFQSKCGRYYIVFNGEIVNYNFLKKNLIKKKILLKYGHEAEIIMNLFKLYGPKCVKFLRGFFSFVIIDLKNNEVFGAVDRHSIKPLYYTHDKINKIFICTSDYSATLKSGLVKKKINFQKIIDFLIFARQFDDNTIISNIKKLSQATYFSIKKDKIRLNNYWQPFVFSKYKDLKINKNRIINKLNQNFIDLIKNWKTSDEKISLCLSSGLDSLIIKKYLNKAKVSVKSYSILEGKKIYGIDKKISLNTKKIIKLINNYCKDNFNPFPLANSSSTSLFQIYEKLSHDKFKVTFNGEGSDEHFGGYTRYNRTIKYIKSGHKFNDAIMKTFNKEIELLYSVLKKEKRKFKNRIKSKIKSIKLKSKKEENKILEFDQLTWIPALIQRHDMIGMNFGLEVRPPFLDHELVSYINTLPTKYKFNNSARKIILNDLLKKKFNHKFINHKFGTPSVYKEIMRDQKEIKSFKKSLSRKEFSKYFDIKQIMKILKSHNNQEIFIWRLYVISKMFNNFKLSL